MNLRRGMRNSDGNTFGRKWYWTRDRVVPDLFVSSYLHYIGSFDCACDYLVTYLTIELEINAYVI